MTRILDAGGHIMGKAVCENLCFSGRAAIPMPPVRCSTRTITAVPPAARRAAAGALVAAGVVDMAIGGDQGGSIRMPASWCGIYGHKPTYGLVPYTGIMPIEITLDHTGPMTRSVHDAALLLEVLAGPDGLDPRQQAGLQGQAYTQALSGDISGLRIGVVEEGFWLGRVGTGR